MRRETLDAPVRCDLDLFRLWRALMGPGGFAQRTLWLLFLQPDGYPTRVLVPIEDLPESPDDQFVRSVQQIASGIVSEVLVGSVPTLLSRPGPDGMTAADRRWATALRRDAPAELLRWPIHLATCDCLQVFAPDDLIAVS